MLKNKQTASLFVVLISVYCLLFVQCKDRQEDKSSPGMSHEDVVSLEQNSVFSYESFVYEGNFEGLYENEKLMLVLKKNGRYVLGYRGKEYKGEWTKKDDGSLMELDAKKHRLPFQFFKWSDNTEIMILNPDGMADENGENYLTRLK